MLHFVLRDNGRKALFTAFFVLMKGPVHLLSLHYLFVHILNYFAKYFAESCLLHMFFCLFANGINMFISVSNAVLCCFISSDHLTFDMDKCIFRGGIVLAWARVRDMGMDLNLAWARGVDEDVDVGLGLAWVRGVDPGLDLSGVDPDLDTRAMDPDLDSRGVDLDLDSCGVGPDLARTWTYVVKTEEGCWR